MTAGLLEAILKAAPNLKELSVTWLERGRNPPTAANLWPQVGQILNQRGLSLRKIHFECKRTPRGLLINPKRLCDLHSLAIPIEAVMIEPAAIVCELGCCIVEPSLRKKLLIYIYELYTAKTKKNPQVHDLDALLLHRSQPLPSLRRKMSEKARALSFPFLSPYLADANRSRCK